MTWQQYSIVTNVWWPFLLWDLLSLESQTAKTSEYRVGANRDQHVSPRKNPSQGPDPFSHVGCKYFCCGAWTWQELHITNFDFHFLHGIKHKCKSKFDPNSWFPSWRVLKGLWSTANAFSRHVPDVVQPSKDWCYCSKIFSWKLSKAQLHKIKLLNWEQWKVAVSVSAFHI